MRNKFIVLSQKPHLLWPGYGIIIVIVAWIIVRKPIMALALGGFVSVVIISIPIILRPKRIVPALLIVAIVLPFIRLPGSIPDIRPEFILTLMGWGIITIRGLALGESIRIRRCPPYKWFVLFGLSIVLSMNYAAWFKGQPVIARDFWELVKVCLYLLLFALVASRNISTKDLQRYYKLALVLFMLSAVTGFLQYIDFAGINESISLYYAPTQMRGLLVHKRITGTTPNPNEFGALMVLASSLALSGGLFLQDKELRNFAWVMLPVYILALVLTLSRTSLVSLLLAGVMVISLFLRRKEFKGKYLRIIKIGMLLAIIGIIALLVMPQKAFYRYGQLATFTQATSWQGRVINWKINFSIWLGSPWFGWGPGKANMSTIVDNEWLLLLRRYGVVGLTVFLGFFGSLFLGLARIGRENANSVAVALSVALRGTWVGYGLYMALASIYHSLQLMPIFLVFLGLAYSQWKPAGRVP